MGVEKVCVFSGVLVLIHTWGWRATVTFEEIEDGTRLTHTIRHRSRQARDGHLQAGMENCASGQEREEVPTGIHILTLRSLDLFDRREPG